ncbi:MAG: hypothetical protein ACYS0E_12840 [Planctomycetota bacterium]
MHAHEEAFIRAFLTAAYRARCLAKKGIPREDLHHVVGTKLDRRRALELPSARSDETLSLLSDLGDFDSGYCISNRSEWDDRVISLDEFCEVDDATIVSFVPGELAYFSEESYCPTARYLLVSDPALQRKVRPRIRP